MLLPDALAKARRYCALQERCHQVVRDKLYGWGSHQEEVEQVIGQLQQRYQAKQYARKN